ncbi:MAG: YicC family protein [Methylovulum sp.]|nr:YicC family protein [Methylovulum sp.]
MTKSMTAFASNETEINHLMLSCELRSVNHRYCDINIKIPDHLRFAETTLRTLISDAVGRGKIECIISHKKNGASSNTIHVNKASVKALQEATQLITDLIPSCSAFSALDVLAYPGVQQEQELNATDILACLQDLVKKTVADFLIVREREGKQLQQLLLERCQKSQSYIEQASQRMPSVLSALHKKYKNRILELISQPDFDRLEQELVILAQRLDVTEELDRLHTHINEVQRTLTQHEPVGRRLDFLMQELNREANTLGAKSADKEMTQIAIELKVLIEQMREQIQNIE